MSPSKQSNHMVEYYRKQSDRKMVQTIINMRSQFYQHFTQSNQKQHPSKTQYQKHHNLTINQTFLNNKNKQNLEKQQLKAQQIHLENQQIVHRLKRARQMSSNQYKQYLDFSISQRLLQTRNQFRQKAKDENKNKVEYENQLLLKRILETKSEYSLENSQKNLKIKTKNKQKQLIYRPQLKLNNKNTLINRKTLLYELQNQQIGLIKSKKSTKRIKTENIPANKIIDENSLDLIANKLDFDLDHDNFNIKQKSRRYNDKNNLIEINTGDISLVRNQAENSNRKKKVKSVMSHYPVILRQKMSQSINKRLVKRGKQRRSLTDNQWSQGLYKIVI